MPSNNRNDDLSEAAKKMRSGDSDERSEGASELGRAGGQGRGNQDQDDDENENNNRSSRSGSQNQGGSRSGSSGGQSGSR